MSRQDTNITAVFHLFSQHSLHGFIVAGPITIMEPAIGVAYMIRHERPVAHIRNGVSCVELSLKPGEIFHSPSHAISYNLNNLLNSWSPIFSTTSFHLQIR